VSWRVWKNELNLANPEYKGIEIHRGIKSYAGQPSSVY
jgi:hypothetical protein